MEKIKIIVVDDHVIVRDGLCDMINGQDDFELIGNSGDGQEALEKIQSLRPDVLILDIAMPKMDGLGLCGLVKEISQDTRIVIFSMHQKEAYVKQALNSGAMGYVLKSAPTSHLVEAIRTVHNKNYYLSPSISKYLVNHYLKSTDSESKKTGYDSLTEREQGVFRLMAEGSPTKQMAELLCISPKTVEKHRSRVLKKLELKTPMDIMKYAIKIGLIDPQLWE